MNNCMSSHGEDAGSSLFFTKPTIVIMHFQRHMYIPLLECVLKTTLDELDKPNAQYG